MKAYKLSKPTAWYPRVILVQLTVHRVAVHLATAVSLVGAYCVVCRSTPYARGNGCAAHTNGIRKRDVPTGSGIFASGKSNGEPHSLRPNPPWLCPWKFGMQITMLRLDNDGHRDLFKLHQRLLRSLRNPKCNLSCFLLTSTRLPSEVGLGHNVVPLGPSILLANARYTMALAWMLSLFS